MNPSLTSLNGLGSHWANLAWAGFCQSSILIALVWLADVVLRRRVRPVVRYALWMLVPLKLLLPASFALPTGAGYWIPRPWIPEGQARFAQWRLENRVAEPRFPLLIADEPASVPVAGGPAVAVSGPAVAFLIWWVGVLVLGTKVVIRSRRLHMALRKTTSVGSKPPVEWERLKNEIPVSGRVSWLWTDGCHSPALAGLWHPTLLMPRGLEERLSPVQWRAVLVHELVHVRRGDLWINLIQVIAQILWWWNPVVWLANARIGAVREEVVDDEVAYRLGADAGEYPEALVVVARNALVRPALGLGFLGMVESGSHLRRRIERLLDHPPTALPRVGGWSGAAVVATGLLLLPMAYGNPDGDRVLSSTLGGMHQFADATAPGIAPREGEILGGSSPQGLVTRRLGLDYRRFIPALEVRLGRDLGEDFEAWRAGTREVLERGGVAIGAPNAFFMSLREPLLVFRGSAEDVARAEALVRELNAAPALIQIETHLLEVAEAEFRELMGDVLLAGAAGASPVGARSLTPSESSQLLSRARRQPGVLSRVVPRVTTLADREVELRVSETNDLPLDLSLRWFPRLAASGAVIQLDSTVQLTQTVDLRQSSPPDASGPAWKILNDGGVYAVNAIGYVSRSWTNSVRVTDGSTQLMGDLQPVGSPDFHARRVLVLVTPTVVDPAGNRVNPDR